MMNYIIPLFATLLLLVPLELGAQTSGRSDQLETAPQIGSSRLNQDMRMESSLNLDQSPEAPTTVQERERDLAFQGALNSILPLEPDQIKELLRELRESQEASQRRVREVVPEIKVAPISLDPSMPPPVINVVSGLVTTVSMLDASGQPWPIEDIAYGGQFDIKPPGSGGHVIRITPMSEFGGGNMSIRLVGIPTPITFQLVSGEKTVHYRFDARLPRLGPNAETPLIDRGIDIVAGDGQLMAILDGVPPQTANRMSVEGVDGRTQVWTIGDQMYLRTPFKLLSPSWSGSVSSSDGLNVYALSESPVVLLSDNGEVKRAMISQRDESL
jgi:intracellular multiplication protein IcmK